MDEFRQGQVWVADLPPPFSRRPVLILTRNAAIARLQNIVVATVSTNIRHADTEVLLEPSDGMQKRCAISLDNLHTIGKQYLDSIITELSAERMNEVFEAIHLAFDLPH